jgi:HK97 family phage major capsid protein
MSKINALREQRTALAKETRNLLDNYPGAKWGEEQTKIYDAKVQEIGRIDAEIARFQKQADIDADNAVDAVINDASARQAKKDPTGVAAIYDAFIRRGPEGFKGEEVQKFRNTMSTTTGSEGGFTVPALIASQFYDLMKAFGTMRTTSDSLKTSDGKNLSYPTTDGTAEVGEIVAQNASAASQDLVFGNASLNVFKFGSKIVAVPIELLQDSVVNIEALVTKRLAQRIGRFGNTKFTIGAGTTEPDGIVPKATVGKVGTTGQTLTIIYDDVIDVIHSLDPSYRGAGAAFMTSDSLLKVLRKIKDTAGRPIWTPSYDGGIRVGMGSPGTAQDGGFSGQEQPVIFDYLAGYPVWVNNDMAVPAANAKSLVFGNLKYYVIRDAMDVSMFRFTDSVYTSKGQVGFLAWARMGGNLMDTTAVKYYAHSAT